MSKDLDRPIFDATAPDRRRAFKYFVANFHDYCVIHDLVNPPKEQNSADYWITAKRPKALAALRRAFPQSEWDVLTTTIDAQIPEEHKANPNTVFFVHSLKSMECLSRIGILRYVCIIKDVIFHRRRLIAYNECTKRITSS